MGWTPKTAVVNENGGSSTTIAVTSGTTTVSHGDLIVISVSSFAAQDITGITETGGDIGSGGSANTFTPVATNVNGNDRLKYFYCLSSTSAGATATPLTWTATYAAASTARAIAVGFATPTGTAALDTYSPVGSAGTGTAAVTASGTTTSTDEIVYGTCCNENSAVMSAQLVNGVAADGSINTGGNSLSLWWKVEVATFTGTVSCTIASSTRWTIQGLGFTNTAAGPTGPAPYYYQRKSLYFI